MKSFVALIFLSIVNNCFSQSNITNIKDYSSFILTPKAPESPLLNNVKVFGVRPGSDFLYTIPATGVRPIKYSAQNLPKGLILDTKTGLIRGKILKTGVYNVKLYAENSKGKDSRDFCIKVGNDIALTPPMGWNSWNCWGNSVSQEKVLSSAKAMVEKGLVNYGWTYVNIDDGWQGVRGGKYNAIQPNIKFPDIKNLSQQIHKMGLKIGIYSGPWVGTYAGHIGSMCDNKDGSYDWIKNGEINANCKYCLPSDTLGNKVRYEHYYHGKFSFAQQDATQWADWGIDYLKYDWNPNDYFYAKEMSDALKKQKRDIVYSLSNNAPFGDAPMWLNLANCYRTTGDIRDSWYSIYKIGFKEQDKWIAFNRPGHWADPDMLVVGMVGWGPRLHNTYLTPDEQFTHISLWAMLSSPMLIGCDMSQLDDFTISLLCNREVNDINQDPLGIQGYPLFRTDDYVVYVKQLEDGSMAVGLFNISNQMQTIKFSLPDLGIRGKQTIRDVWRQIDVKTISDEENYSSVVAPHGVNLLKILPGNSKERKIGK